MINAKGLIESKNPRFVTPNELMDPVNIHEWLLKPLRERLKGSLVMDDSTTSHQSTWKSLKVEQPDIEIRKGTNVTSAVFLGEKFRIRIKSGF